MVALLLGAVVAAGLVVLGIQQARVERCRRALRSATLHDTVVHVVPHIDTAWTAGPLLPRVFVGERLLRVLADDEQRAVILHERAHQRRYDPLAVAFGSMVDRFVPTAQRGRRTPWRDGADARREMQADAAALRDGATREALASALLKIGQGAPVGVGFAPASERRVRALLDGTAPSRGVARTKIAVTSAVVGAVLCTWAAHHAIATAVLGCC